MVGRGWDVWVHEDIEGTARVYLFDRPIGERDACCLTPGPEGEWISTPLGPEGDMPMLLRTTVRPALTLPTTAFHRLQMFGKSAPVSLDAIREHRDDAMRVRDRLLAIVEKGAD